MANEPNEFAPRQHRALELSIMPRVFSKQLKTPYQHAHHEMVDNLLANSMAWSAARPNAFRIEADFVTCTQ